MFPERIFSFISMAYPGDTFSMLSFTAEEGLSQLFRIELLLSSKEPDIDFKDILESPASCVIHAPDKDLPLHGVVSRFEQLHHAQGLTFYRAVLSPRLWWLTLVEHNQVFLDMTVPQILEQVLQDGGLSSKEYLFKLQQDYPVRELVCQYNESHYHFFLRWLEREGMYYYFERHDDQSILVVTDTVIAHSDLRRHNEIHYAPPSGVRHGTDAEVIHSIICRQEPATGHVQLKDHNYQTPDLDITALHTVEELGHGGCYHYGDNILTPTEARRLAQIRSEAHTANALRYHGASTALAMRTGFFFTLNNHYRNDFNRDYLVVSCSHKGTRASYLDAGLRKELGGLIEQGPAYENTFTAIPADIQYRPLRTVRKPRVSGTLTARIDAAGSGQYAELDEQGRYKIILPFDLSGRKDGQASCWVRMVQPYAGANHGLHLPLHKGTEVLLSFEAGDPDRPVITGAVPNPATPSPVTNADQTMCKLTTSGGSKLHIEDKQGSQRILMSTPTGETWLRMGAPNDPPAAAVGSDDTTPADAGWGDVSKDTGGFRWSTSGNWYGVIGEHLSISVGGNSTSITIGGSESIVGGFSNSTVVGLRNNITLGGSITFNVAANLNIGIGGTWVVDLEKHGKFRPNCLKVAAEKVNVVDMDTKVGQLVNEMAEAKAALLESESKLLEQKNCIAENASAIVAAEEAIRETNTSIASTETRIMEEVTRISDEDMMLVDAHMSMLSDRLEMCESDLKMASDSLEMVESKIFV